MRILFILMIAFSLSAIAQQRPRELGINFGVLEPGILNAITDVAGVKVGHKTIMNGDFFTGITVIVPHSDNIFQSKVSAGVFVGNGFGKLAGTTQVVELGNIETPIALTNTLSVGAGIEALVKFTLNFEGNENVKSVNAIVGETNDGYLNDIRSMHLKQRDFLDALENAKGGIVKEGNVGAGTGTICYGFKGGIGTSSRKIPSHNGGYTVGVLVQTNFGGVLCIDGVPVGEELGKYYMRNAYESPDGSCMIIIATDAPIGERNLTRLASRSMLGLARTGGIASNGSGDYAIAFSTAKEQRVPHNSNGGKIKREELSNNDVSPLFLAVIEATEEAIINSLFAAKSLTGFRGHKIEALPVDDVLNIMKKYNNLHED